MSPDIRIIDPKDSAQVYDEAAVSFRNRAPELLTYRYIVAPALHRHLEAYVSNDRGTKRVLDVGSASGRNEYLLMKEGFAAANILGVEISPEQVAIAKREIPDATFEVGDISTYPLVSESCDLAVMVMVPEFLDEGKYSGALGNIFDALDNDGVFIYITTHPDRYDAKYGVKEGEVITKGPWGEGAFSNYVRSVKKQVQALREAGFRVMKVEELDIPESVAAEHAEFTHPDRHVRLVIVSRKF